MCQPTVPSKPQDSRNTDSAGHHVVLNRIAWLPAQGIAKNWRRAGPEAAYLVGDLCTAPNRNWKGTIVSTGLIGLHSLTMIEHARQVWVSHFGAKLQTCMKCGLQAASGILPTSGRGLQLLLVVAWLPSQP